MKLYLIDGHSMAYRAFYAIPRLTNTRGELTNAVYGFCTMLLKILKEKPEYAAVCFDSAEPTFRHKIFPEYKAQRERMPDEMSTQMERIAELLPALGVFSISVSGYEADDIIATLAKRYRESVDEVIIFTQDKDILQIVDEKVKVLSSKKGIDLEMVYDRDGVISRFGVAPEKIPEYLMLTGDASDNIPGVKGIGEKAAKRLLAQFGSIEEILSNLDRIEPRLASSLSKAKKVLSADRELFMLESKIPIEIELSELKVRDQDRDRLFSIFLELEFKSLIEELGLKREEKAVYSEFLPKEVEGLKAVSVLEKERKLLLSDGKKNWQIDKIEEAKQIFEDPKVEKIGHNIKALILMLSEQKIRLSGELFDVMVASYLLTPGTKQDFESIMIRYAKGEEESPATLFLLKEKLEKHLKDEGLFDLFCKIEMPLVKVLADMEREGISVDKKHLLGFSEILSNRLSELSEKIYSSAGAEFNINSPKQLSTILFEKLKLPIIKQTKTGYSTNEEVLVALSNLHPLPGLILEYRELAKLKSTYADGLIPLIKEGKVHTSFNQTVTATGRLSSSNPNLQNIPVRTDLGKQIRKAFIAQPGKILLSADYSQIELRILAHLSQDELLLSSFSEGKDIHTETAARIYDVSPEFVTEAMRRHAKAVNFGIIYGMSKFGLSKEIGVSESQAQAIIDRYFELHRGVADYIEKGLMIARERGWVETMFGRRRYIPELFSKNKREREFGERAAINMPIQGSCADIIKKAMVELSNLTSAKMLIQVHDELIFETEKDFLEKAAGVIVECMENVVELSVPLRVNISSGESWGEL